MTNLSAIDLNLLVAFDALMAEGNVTRAGVRLGISQPALSKALGRLRHVFDDPLFVRGEGRMQPTARAQQLAEPVRRALLEIERAMTPAARFNPEQAAGTVVLATTDLADFLLMPRLIACLRRTAPGIDIRVRSCNRLSVHAMLAADEADLAILPMGETVSDFRAEPLFQEPVACLVAQDHPITGDADTLSIEDFVAAPHVIVSTEARGGTVIDSLLATRGLERRVQLIVPSFMNLPGIVAASDLIATVPARFAEKMLAIGGLRMFKPPLPLVDTTMHQVWHARKDHDPVQAWLRFAIKELASEFGPARLADDDELDLFGRN